MSADGQMNADGRFAAGADGGDAAGAGADGGFAVFARRVAEATGIPVEAIQPESRLVEDLGLDSLAVMEVVVVLLVDYELEALSDHLQQSGLAGVTVQEVYELAAAGGTRRWRVEME